MKVMRERGRERGRVGEREGGTESRQEGGRQGEQARGKESRREGGERQGRRKELRRLDLEKYVPGDARSCDSET